MNLLCPSCQKQLQVGEQYAGQMMKCPLCSATFTVPVVPQMPAAASSPPVPPPSAPGQFTASAPPKPAGFGEAPAGAPQVRGLTINPRLIAWLAPVCLILIFVCLFFSWAGMYPGGVPVLTQSGWQVAFGSTSYDEKWKGYATNSNEQYWKNTYDAKAVEGLLTPGFSLLLVLFILLLFPTLLAALVSVAIASKLLPIEVPAGLASIWPLRSLLVGGLALLMLLLLMLSLASGLPLEQKAVEQVKATVTAMREAASTAEKNEPLRWDIEQGVRLGGYAVRTTAWLGLVLVLNILAVLGTVADFWIERRGTQPLPRLELIR
jgi:hypothetical protein